MVQKRVTKFYAWVWGEPTETDAGLRLVFEKSLGQPQCPPGSFIYSLELPTPLITDKQMLQVVQIAAKVEQAQQVNGRGLAVSIANEVHAYAGRFGTGGTSNNTWMYLVFDGLVSVGARSVKIDGRPAQLRECVLDSQHPP